MWSLCSVVPFLTCLFFPQRKPAVLRGVNLGPCLEQWTVEYLRQRGSDKEVKIHVSTVPQMDFLHKNFVYKWAVSHANTQKCRGRIQVSAMLVHSQDFAIQWICEKGIWKKTLWLLSVRGNNYKDFVFITCSYYCLCNLMRWLIAGWELLSSLTGRGRTQGRNHNREFAAWRFPVEAPHCCDGLLNRSLLILANSFQTWLRISTFLTSLARISFSPVCFASVPVVCSCGHTTMWVFCFQLHFDFKASR